MICKLFLHSPFISIKLYPLIDIIYIERVLEIGENGENRMWAQSSRGKAWKTGEILGKTLWGGVFRVFFA